MNGWPTPTGRNGRIAGDVVGLQRDGDEAHGKPAGSLNYGVSSKLLMIMRDNGRLNFDEATPLEAGDRVVMLLRREGWQVNHKRIYRIYKEELTKAVEKYGARSSPR